MGGKPAPSAPILPGSKVMNGDVTPASIALPNQMASDSVPT